jgi:hypothetical protein
MARAAAFTPARASQSIGGARAGPPTGTQRLKESVLEIQKPAALGNVQGDKFPCVALE